jgi:hypothetical protein
MTSSDKYLLVFVSLAAIIGLLSLVGHAVIAAAEHEPPATGQQIRDRIRIAAAYTLAAYVVVLLGYGILRYMGVGLT